MRRCMDWRNCEICARARQATLAWRGELLEQQFDTLFLSVLKPVDTTAQAIQRVRAGLMRCARQMIPTTLPTTWRAWMWPSWLNTPMHKA